MLKQLKREIQLLPPPEQMEHLSNDDKICLYAPTLIVICKMVGVLPFGWLRIAMAGVIAALEAKCGNSGGRQDTHP